MEKVIAELIKASDNNDTEKVISLTNELMEVLDNVTLNK